MSDAPSPDAPEEAAESPPAQAASGSEWALGCILVPAVILLGIVGLWWAFLLPGAAAFMVVDCLSDLHCSFALAARGTTSYKPSDHDGVGAVVAALLFVGLGGTAAWTSGAFLSGVTWELVTDDDGRDTPKLVQGAAAVAVLAVSVAVMAWIDANT